MELSSGTLLQGGKYKIDKVLGQGGFGITYLAEQTNLGRKVCIKEFFMKEYGERTASPRTDSEETVLTGGIPLSSPVAKDAEATVLSDNDSTVLTGVSAVTTGAAEIMGKYREKFVKEARTIARLDHPGIVRIHDVFEENGTAYYVMDFIEGDNLNEIVKREGALPEERALGYIRQIGDALSYVHGHNIMHLDVKPANVIVRKSDGKAILIDFGTAKQYDSEGSQTSTTPVGLSVGYAPIEMTKPGGVQTFSPETDVYSLGATLYYLVTGQNPLDASERMEMIMDGEKFQLPESISSSTAEVIEQSMQARKKRVQTVEDFLNLLKSDGADARQKEAEAEDEKARAEAEREEALRKEQEQAAAAEKKRKAEEQAKKDAEVKALKKQEAKKNSTNGWLIGISVLLLLGGIVMLILANTQGFPSAYDPFGYIGFGLFCGAALFSFICISRKAAKGFSTCSLIVSLLLAVVCLVDAIQEDNDFGPFPYFSGPYYKGSEISYTPYPNSLVINFSGNVEMPKDIYLQEGNVDKNSLRVASNHIINYTINGRELTIKNLKSNTTYSILFVNYAYTWYGIFGSYRSYHEPELEAFIFNTSQY